MHTRAGGSVSTLMYAWIRGSYKNVQDVSFFSEMLLDDNSSIGNTERSSKD